MRILIVLLLIFVVLVCLKIFVFGHPSDILNAVIVNPAYKKHTDIAYGDKSRQKLDIYVANKPQNGSPLIIFFYGGSWQYGNKNYYPFLAQTLTKMGYSVVIPNYRVYPEVRYPAFLEDTVAATKWVLDNASSYQINATNTFLMGHSAGAYNTAMALLHPDFANAVSLDKKRISGAIVLAGPYDFLPFTSNALKDIFSTQKDTLTQPVNYVTPDDTTPFLILTGASDTTVLPENSVRLQAALKRNNHDATHVSYQGLGHYGIIRAFSWLTVSKEKLLADVQTFTKRMMTKESKLVKAKPPHTRR